MRPHHLSLTQFIGTVPGLNFEIFIFLNSLLDNIEELLGLLIVDSHIISHGDYNLSNLSLLQNASLVFDLDLVLVQ